MSTFETAFSRFPNHIKADVNYQIKQLERDSEGGTAEGKIKEYKDFIVANRHEPKNFLFYALFFEDEQKSIDRQIFHLKHDRVSRTGMKCSYCGSTNTKVRIVQRRSADEMPDTIIYCNNCKRITKN